MPLGGNDDEDEETNEKDLSTHSNISRRRSLGGRRRSSFGSHSSKSPGSAVEQSRIAEMYKNVIKLSFENVRSLSSRNETNAKVAPLNIFKIHHRRKSMTKTRGI